MALGNERKQGALQKEFTSVTMRDDMKFYFGDDQDVSLEYDEDGTDTLMIDGGNVLVADDKKLYFGTSKDGYIGYDETGTVASDTLGIFDTTSGAVFAVAQAAAAGGAGFAKGCILVDITSGVVYTNISDNVTAVWSGLIQ